MTPYLCTTCNLSFEGFDPVRFGKLGQPVYPACPAGIEEATEMFYDDTESTDFWEGPVIFANPQLQAMSVASRKHKVTLAVVEAEPKPKPSFADLVRPKPGDPPPPLPKEVGVFRYKAPTAQERAQSLISWIDKCCSSNDYGSSANYIADRLYPASNKPKHETAEVIALARTIWDQRTTPALNHHSTDAQFKNDWRQRTEVDFIRKIRDGQDGRHIVHVVVGTRGEKGWINA